ncbi:hypothetical protein GCM10009557_93340 [Virgisporangium ochraceum]|uniref:Uncharacterized protein n=1 Tax=Virgisporangium ochraceum TaxID=65505 RepID=A0A8J4EGL7_9ACTN|nr:hypothetical protein [Virgisporangium ochraceum]GIJ74019.1 hypothetical protein Voc01_089360 [Virgisporangium ochraceum]
MTRLALAVVRVAAALLPGADRRARYLEQWRADVHGAADLDLSALRVALGAGAAALRIAATTPSEGTHAMLPIGPLALALRLVGGSRTHAALLAGLSALALLGGVVLLISG